MKKWYMSKTYWFNISLAIVGMLQTNIPLVQDQLGGNYGWILMGISAIGIMLRNVTSTKIKLK